MPKDVIDQKAPPCTGEGRARVSGLLGRGVLQQRSSEEAPGRHATPPTPTGCLSLPMLADSLHGKAGGLVSVLPTHSGGREA